MQRTSARQHQPILTKTAFSKVSDGCERSSETYTIMTLTQQFNLHRRVHVSHPPTFSPVASISGGRPARGIPCRPVPATQRTGSFSPAHYPPPPPLVDPTPALACQRPRRRSPRSAKPRLAHHLWRVPAASTRVLVPCAPSALAVATAAPVAPPPPLLPAPPPSPQPPTTTVRGRRGLYRLAGAAVREAAAAAGGATRSIPTTPDGTLDGGGTAHRDSHFITPSGTTHAPAHGGYDPPPPITTPRQRRCPRPPVVVAATGRLLARRGVSPHSSSEERWRRRPVVPGTYLAPIVGVHRGHHVSGDCGGLGWIGRVLSRGGVFKSPWRRRQWRRYMRCVVAARAVGGGP